MRGARRHAIEIWGRTCQPEPAKNGEPVRRNVQKGTRVITRAVARLVDGRHDACPLQRNSERRSRNAGSNDQHLFGRPHRNRLDRMAASSSFAMPSSMARVFLDLAAVLRILRVDPCRSG